MLLHFVGVFFFRHFFFFTLNGSSLMLSFFLFVLVFAFFCFLSCVTLFIYCAVVVCLFVYLFICLVLVFFLLVLCFFVSFFLPSFISSFLYSLVSCFFSSLVRFTNCFPRPRCRLRMTGRRCELRRRGPQGRGRGALQQQRRHGLRPPQARRLGVLQQIRQRVHPGAGTAHVCIALLSEDVPSKRQFRPLTSDRTDSRLPIRDYRCMWASYTGFCRAQFYRNICLTPLKLAWCSYK